MPGYNKNSDFAFALEVSDGQRRHAVIDRRASGMSEDPALQPRPGQRLMPMGGALELTEPITLRTEQGVGVLAGAVPGGANHLDKAD